MKYSLLIVLLIALEAKCVDVSLIMTCAPNTTVDNGSTYRLFAVIPVDASLQVVYGDNKNPLRIQASTSFFQHALGSNTSAGIHPEVESIQQGVKSDSWITIGCENQVNNHLWDVGLELSAFAEGGNIYCDNGGWFLVPSDLHCMPNEEGWVLLGQFTSTGTVSGVLNLQGRDGNGVWKQTGLSFSSDNCLIPGCTDAQFNNYNPLAEINDGSCNGSCLDALGGVASANNSWTVFPNPLRENLFHIQFNGFHFPSAELGYLEIRDASGKCILNQSIQKETMNDTNRLTIEQSMAPGNYEVILQQGTFREFRKMVVVK